MADIEPYCDSDEEVFFGPFTEKERLIYEALKMKEIDNGNTEEVPAKYVGGDEGLHALAEAASMLSISSGEVDKIKDEKVSQGSMGEGSTMELDAVKFLTKHIPEQNGRYENANSHAEYMDETYHCSGVAHNTSLASPVDNNSCSIDNPVCANSPADSFLVLEAQCKMEADPLEKKRGNFIPICELEQLPPLNLSTTELQDVNDKSDFELSENEEEREKVEEIIKFLADEDIKPDSEERKDTFVETSEQDMLSQRNPPQDSNSEVNENDVLIIETDVVEVIDLTDYQSPEEEKFSTNTEINVQCELNDNGAIVKLLSASLEEINSKQICVEAVKIPKLPLEERDRKEVSHLPVMKQNGKVSSLSSKGVSVPVPSVTQRRLKTPSKVLLRPVHGTGTTGLHKQPLIGDTKRHNGTAAHAASPIPAKNTTASSHTPLKGMSGTTGSSFKTPNSKANLLAASKIPQVIHHVTPSPRKNKYADIMSPVAQYIHGSSSLLVANNVPALKITSRKQPINSKCVASGKADSVDRGAENIDVNNISSAPLPSNIHYKSAVPVKIVSPNPKKCLGNGPVGSVSKHLGRIKITSLQSGKVLVPLSMQCRDSLIPEGEVSVLLTEEMSAGHTSTL